MQTAKTSGLIFLMFSLLCCVNYSPLQAQDKSNNVWVYADGIRVDFNSGVAVVDTLRGLSNRLWGLVSSYCDPESGELLFFTGDSNVWNYRNDTAIYSPVNHHHSSNSIYGESHIILPSACPRRYFVFSASDDHDHGEYGIEYSIFDIDMRDGRGGTRRNEYSVSVSRHRTRSCLTAIHKRNLDGYWVIGHEYNSDRFLACAVDGITVAEPVLSRAGDKIDYGGPAVLKVSTDGSRLAMCVHNQNSVQLFDFDNLTGIVSGPTAEITKTVNAVEFSPDGTKLYTIEVRGEGVPWFLELWQYDLNAADLEQSGRRLLRIAEYSSNKYSRWLGHAGLANGPDGSLYCNAPIRTVLYQVENPNDAALQIKIDSLKTPNHLRYEDSFVNQYVGLPISFEEPNFKVDLILTDDETICEGDSVEIKLTTEYEGEVEWSPTQGLTDPAARLLKASPEKTTTYYVNFRGKCLYGRDSITIRVGRIPQLQVSQKQTICAGESVELEASGAETFTWGPSRDLDAHATPIVLATPLETTVYRVIGRNLGGCADTAWVEVEVLPSPEFDLGPNVTICPGGQVQLQATDGVEYRWWPDLDISDVNIAEPWVSPSEDRTYYVEVKNAVGCSKIDSIVVYVRNDISLNDGLSYTICRGDAIKLRLNGPDGTYSWQPVDGLSDPTVRQPVARPETSTIYTVRLETDCGSAETQVEVNIQEKPVSRLKPLIICDGQSVELNPDGDASLQHRWDDHPDINDVEAVNPLVQPSQTTTYYLTIGSEGCRTRDSVRVELAPLPPLELSRNARICEGGSTQLTVSGAEEYIWSPATGLSDTRSANPTASPKLTTMYYVRGRIDGACESIDSVLVEVVSAPRVSLEPAEPVICSGESLQLRLRSTADLQSVRWIPATGLNNPYIINPIVTLDRAQDYRVEFTSVEGCSGSFDLRVEVGRQPKLTVDNPLVEICADNKDGIAATVTVGGAQDYEWYDAAGVIVHRSASWQIPYGQAAGRYRIVGRDAAGCAAESEIEIVYKDAPQLLVPDFYRICAGESVQLSAGGGVRYRWSPAEGLDDPESATPLASPREDRDYTVEVFNAEACSAQATVRVEVEPRLRLRLTSPDLERPMLPGDELELTFVVDFDGDVAALNKRDFEVALLYPPGALQLQKTDPIVTTGLPAWNINSLESSAKGRLTLSGTSTAVPMPGQFSLTVRMIVLIHRANKAILPLTINSHHLGVNARCDIIDSQLVLPLAEVCLLHDRAILHNGTQFGLLQNTPNPTDDLTEIVYSLGFDTQVELLLTDNLGRVLRRMVDERQTAGTHTYELSTAALGRGQYRYTLRAGPFRATRLLIVH